MNYVGLRFRNVINRKEIVVLREVQHNHYVWKFVGQEEEESEYTLTEGWIMSTLEGGNYRWKLSGSFETPTDKQYEEMV